MFLVHMKREKSPDYRPPQRLEKVVAPVGSPTKSATACARFLGVVGIERRRLGGGRGGKRLFRTIQPAVRSFFSTHLEAHEAGGQEDDDANAEDDERLSPVAPEEETDRRLALSSSSSWACRCRKARHGVDSE